MYMHTCTDPGWRAQHAAEAHIVSVVAFGEAPEWGCDAFWEPGDEADVVAERCMAVFGVFFFDIGGTSPPWCARTCLHVPRRFSWPTHRLDHSQFRRQLPGHTGGSRPGCALLPSALWCVVQVGRLLR